MYLKGMRALIKDLANQKKDLRSKIDVMKMKDDVEKIHQNSYQMNQGIQLLSYQDN